MIYQWALGPAIWVVPALVAVVAVMRGFRLRRVGARATEYGLDEAQADTLLAKSKGSFKVAMWSAGFLLLISPALAFVPAGHRGVVYDLAGGVLPEERPEGLTLVIPWFQHVSLVDVRTQVYTNQEFYAQSSDLQEIKVPVAINYHIDPERAAELYAEVGPGYASTVVRPAIDQHGKAAIGQVVAEAFAAERDSLAGAMVEGISAQLAEYGIIVEYANVADAVFDGEFLAAVRGKVVAQQNVIEARNRVQEERYRKQQEIQKAQAARITAILAGQGVAEANRLIEESLTDDVLVYLRLTLWDGRLPSTLIGEGSPLNAIVQLPEVGAPPVEEEPDPDPYSMGTEEEETP